jgi:hypothetical protein
MVIINIKRKPKGQSETQAPEEIQGDYQSQQSDLVGFSCSYLTPLF